MKIIVNGHALPLKLTYDQIIELAGFDAGRVLTGRGLTVTYRGETKIDVRRQGTLAPGEEVAVEDGMRFSVSDTSSA